MKVVFLTADDPLYLPDFFDTVLTRLGPEKCVVYRISPLYKNQSSAAAAWRYFRTFGAAATAQLTARVARAKVARRSIAEVCRRHGVPCGFARNVNAPEYLEELRRHAPDLVVSVSCPQIFEKSLLALPARGVLNVHGAMLPRYRGVMPGFWMLANGERQAGVSVHFVGEGIDTGDLCGQEVFEILSGESLDHFLRRSKAVAAELVVKVLTAFERGTLAHTPIDAREGSYYSWPDRGAVERFRATGRRVW